MNRPSSPDIWEALHDGVVVEMRGHVPGVVTVLIEIEYLCGELPTAEAYLVLQLRGCKTLQYEPSNGSPIVDLEAIADENLIVLSATAEGDSILIACAADAGSGILRVQYDSLGVVTAEGEEVSPDELYAAAGRYWRAFENGASDA